MRSSPSWLLCVTLSACLTASAWGQGNPLAAPTLPDGLGVNIHFTDPKPGEMEMLAAAGFRWVRMDLSWAGTERVAGQYDFSRFDRLMQALKPHGIRALLILDYSNKLYDQGLSPHSEEGRRAFARWAAAAVTHLRGQGILWEMYNEPNIGFWKPKPNVENYVKLALEVGRAIRAAAPQEMYIGPATSQIDMPFLGECFRAGLLEYWCGVSVHPYRQKGPETAAAEYTALRRLIDRYAPQGKKIAILSGEWGYSAAWKNFDETIQGKMLPRQWLVNLSNDVPLSIWYDWHDDGRDPKEPEHHFGTVLNPYNAGRDPVYDPKPAYRAAKTLATLLAGYKYNKRLAVASSDEHVLLFAKGDAVRVAAWTTAAEPRQVVVPASPGRFAVAAHTGENQPPLTADAQGLKLTLTDAPQYVVHDKLNDLLRLAAAWERAPLEIRQPAGKGSLSLGFSNPLARSIRVAAPQRPVAQVEPGARLALPTHFALLRDVEPKMVDVELAVEGMPRLAQRTWAVASNPLQVEFGPLDAKSMAVQVENASGEHFAGVLRLTDVQGIETSPTLPLAVAKGQAHATVCIPLNRAPEQRFRFGARVEDAQGQLQLLVPTQEYLRIDDFALYTAITLAETYELYADGDHKVPAKHSLSLAAPPAGLPVQPQQCLKIAFQMEPGWKFIQFKPKKADRRKIEGRPKSLVLWLHNDGDPVSPRLRFIDATGQTFQPSGEVVKGRGWRRLVIPMDSAKAGHWGGANDGVVHEPIRWDTLLLLDKTIRDAARQGEVLITSPMLVY